jgi:hypothetical protein
MRRDDIISLGERQAGAGWLGLHRTDSQIDFALLMRIGADAVKITVTHGGPADDAGVRSGDYLVSINGSTFREYMAAPSPPGRPVVVKVYRPGIGDGLFEIKTLERTTRKAVFTKPSKPIAPGRCVERNERLQWLGRVSGRPHLGTVGIAVAARLVSYYCSKSQNRAWPKHRSIAADLGISVPSVKRGIEALRYDGFLSIRSGKNAGGSNSYVMTWPADASMTSAPSDVAAVIPFRRE